MSDGRWSRLTVPFVLSLTLGLAPFTPEPHVVEKLRWLLVDCGAGMKAIDVFDLFMHGAPWAWLVAETVRAVAGWDAPVEESHEGQ